MNNVGVFSAKPFAEIEDDEWMRVLQVNVMSGVRLSRHYVPRMVARGWGRVVFVSSESALQIPAEMIHDGVSKTAQLAVLARSGRDGRGHRCHDQRRPPRAHPLRGRRPVRRRPSPLSRRVTRGSRARVLSRDSVQPRSFAVSRPPTRFASLVTYLASPVSSGTTGAALRVDGGVVRSI